MTWPITFYCHSNHPWHPSEIQGVHPIYLATSTAKYLKTLRWIIGSFSSRYKEILYNKIQSDCPPWHEMPSTFWLPTSVGWLKASAVLDKGRRPWQTFFMEQLKRNMGSLRNTYQDVELTHRTNEQTIFYHRQAQNIQSCNSSFLSTHLGLRHNPQVSNIVCIASLEEHNACWETSCWMNSDPTLWNRWSIQGHRLNWIRYS